MDTKIQTLLDRKGHEVYSIQANQTVYEAITQMDAQNVGSLIVKDGEGLSKVVTVNVTGAETKNAARVIAKAIANSPLVKTAVAGEDPNWGRVVMAVGKAGEAADRDKLAISFGGIEVAKDGEMAPGLVWS